MATNCKKALLEWSAKNDQDPKLASVVKLCAVMPPIKKLDPSVLSGLKNVQHLSLSTNAIEKMVPFNNLPKLKILSLGRNKISRVDGLSSIAASLEQLWMSYNNVAQLDGVLCCQKLEVLYLSNNKIRGWAEVEKLRGLPNLRDILLKGNPIYEDMDTVEEQRVAVLQCVPQVTKIDGKLVTPIEREMAASGEFGK
jgi:dynein light chain 1